MVVLSGLCTALYVGEAAISGAVVEVVNSERNSVPSSLAWLMLTADDGMVGVMSIQLSLLAVPGLEDGERVGL